MTDLWADLDRAVLDCLLAGPVEPADIAKRLGMSEGAASSILILLATEGRVRIRRVSLPDEGGRKAEGR
jgi:hypothetical protein